MSAEFGLSPLVIIQDYADGHTAEVLLRHAPGQIYGLSTTDFEQRAIRARLDFRSAHQVTYCLTSVEYHCVQLCKAYRDVCASFTAVPAAFGGRDDPIVTYQGPVDAYFEFDALITAVRRAYDTLRYMLWKYFGAATGSVPRSFARTLDACVSLPDELADRLAASWRSVGEPATAYRDCIQHYCPVGLGQTVMWMTRMGGGVWSTSARIPDNPSARSQSGFTYGRQLDALRFGWDCAQEVLDIAGLIVEASVVAANRTQGHVGRV